MSVYENAGPGRLERAVKIEQIILLFLCAAPVLLAFILRLENSLVSLPGMESGSESLCLFQACLGIPCPFCGLTRGIIATARLDFMSAVTYNPAGPAVFLFLLLQIPYRIWSISKKEHVPARPWLASLPPALIVSWILGQWVFRLINL